MAHRFLGSVVVTPTLTASVHRVGNVTLEIAKVPTTYCSVQIFVHNNVSDEAPPKGRLLTDDDLAEPGTGYSLHAINIPPCLAIDTSRQVAVLRLANQEQVEDALPEPEQEGALKGLVGETVPCDPGIGGLGPLPDARPDEVEVIEGVRSEAETKAREDFAFDVGIMLSEARGILDDLQHAAEVAIKDIVTSGRLQVQREGLAVSVAWNSDGATLTVQGAILAEEEG